jgi:hypothetical protein
MITSPPVSGMITSGSREDNSREGDVTLLRPASKREARGIGVERDPMPARFVRRVRFVDLRRIDVLSAPHHDLPENGLLSPITVFEYGTSGVE